MSSDWRKESIKRFFAGNLSDTFARHFSINALTPGSATFANDAGFIPYQKMGEKKIRKKYYDGKELPKVPTSTFLFLAYQWDNRAGYKSSNFLKVLWGAH